MEIATAAKAGTQEQRCPQCGADNGCAMAAGQDAITCWCYRTTIDAKALSTLPPDAAGKCCLCPRCGQLQGESSVAR